MGVNGPGGGGDILGYSKRTYADSKAPVLWS